MLVPKYLVRPRDKVVVIVGMTELMSKEMFWYISNLKYVIHILHYIYISDIKYFAGH